MRHSHATTITHSIFLAVWISVFSCASFYVPPAEYLPEEKVVYLKQNPLLVPVSYPPITVDPYEWNVDPAIDERKPSILSYRDFSLFLKPDHAFDARIYKEVKTHLLLMTGDDTYLGMKEALMSHEFAIPEPTTEETGEIVEMYGNGTAYTYPPAEGATITVFDDGAYYVKYADGRKYTQQKDGSYFEEDEKGREMYAVFPAKDSFRTRDGETKFTKDANGVSMETPEGRVKRTRTGDPQYGFTPKNAKYEYTFFTKGESEEFLELALIHDNGLRYDYFPDDDVVTVGYKAENVTITTDMRKVHNRFDEKTRKTAEAYSVYLPEGIRIADLHKQRTYSVVAPKWPENYVSKKIGPFVFAYVKQQENLLAKLDARKLNAAALHVRNATGIVIAQDRWIVLPPDLESFVRLQANEKNHTPGWYPSGFERTDIVVMWPPSVKRYTSKEGEDYFFKTEFYDILVHELTHLAAGEITGVFSALPVWLNEGLALRAECEWSKETKRYWDVTFAVAFRTKRLLGWDDVTMRGTAEYPVNLARIHYAQSYAMVDYLAGKFGIAKVIEYCTSFKTQAGGPEAGTAIGGYKDLFERIFAIDWEGNLAEFERSLVNVE